MDVLRAVAEALADRDRQAVAIDARDRPVGAVAAPGGELDAQQAQRCAGDEAAGRWIARVEHGGDAQRPRVRGGDEAGRAGPQRRDRPALVVCCGDHERQRREEPAVLLGHRIADRAAGRAAACSALRLDLAGVERAGGGDRDRRRAGRSGRGGLCHGVQS